MPVDEILKLKKNPKIQKQPTDHSNRKSGSRNKTRGKTAWKLQCFSCSFETNWKRSLKTHIEQNHPIGGLDYLVCPVCQNKYKGKMNLRIHMNYCGKTDLDKFKCSKCLFKTKWKKCLNRHIAAKHPTRKIIRPVCTKCGKSLADKNCLSAHMKLCGIMERNLECFTCHFKTNLKRTLKEHIFNKHPIGVIKYSDCPVCKKSFKGERSLRFHMKYCGKKNLTQFKCTKCAYKTDRKGNLSRHLEKTHSPHRKNHSVKSNLENIENLRCSGCSFETKRKVTFERHKTLRGCNRVVLSAIGDNTLTSLGQEEDPLL